MADDCMRRTFVILFYTSCLLCAPLASRPDILLRGQPEKEQTTENGQKKDPAVKSSEIFKWAAFQNQRQPVQVKIEQELQNLQDVTLKYSQDLSPVTNVGEQKELSDFVQASGDIPNAIHEPANGKWKRSSNPVNPFPAPSHGAQLQKYLPKNQLQIEAPKEEQDADENDELIKELKNLHLQREPPKAFNSNQRETVPFFRHMLDRKTQTENKETSPKPEQTKKDADNSIKEDNLQDAVGPGKEQGKSKAHNVQDLWQGSKHDHEKETGFEASSKKLNNMKRPLGKNTDYQKEMAELQQLGGTKEEIMRLLPSFDFKFNGFLDPQLNLYHDKNVNQKFNPFEMPKVHENGKQQHSRFNSLVEDRLISDGKPALWRPTAQTNTHYHQAVPEFRSNATANMHFNNPTKHPVGPQYMQMREPQLSAHMNHPITIKDAIQNLQRGNHPDIMRSYAFDGANYFNDGPYHKELLTFPGQNNVNAHQNRFQNQNLGKPHFPVYYSRHGHGPHPSPHWHHKNNSLHSTDLLPSSETKPFPNHDMNLQLSQEMKRELHDGKIIVLSDSLVRSNFANKSDNEKEENTQNSQPTVMPPLTHDQMIKNKDFH
ncbi:uncharacterized protein LOC129231525 isoform X2 [Uloborus diversus]|uniref:uncharacterized protein LOC129231525 isoform X2 n=1 Tax=Uloborus diversus TaxID=327109 RepID=UPI002409F04B|nr:uncharacterized protein LOC129231525 isoform X2 [Uloborus diversus]